MVYIDENIVQRIREVMREKGVTQKGLESDVDIVQSSISQILNLKRSSLPLVEAMSNAYGINKEWLLTGFGEKYSNSAQDQLPVCLQGELTTEDRLTLVREMNALYKRHQEIMDEAGKIMERIAKINERLIFGGNIA